jgi:protocatechuate 3,4-dioxygenase beta subunit
MLLLVTSHRLLAQPASQRALPRAECEGCGAWDAPKTLSSAARIAPAGESGTPLVVSGIVYKPDGRTPAAGVLVYAYHTNAAGVYPSGGNGTGHAGRHGRLRGFVRTDATGRYQFTTIRPAPYPDRGEPAHIHVTVTPPGGEERWIDAIEFDDDPLLIASHRAGRSRLGGSGIVRVTTERDGTQRATRNIVLVTMK